MTEDDDSIREDDTYEDDFTPRPQSPDLDLDQDQHRDLASWRTTCWSWHVASLSSVPDPGSGATIGKSANKDDTNDADDDEEVSPEVEEFVEEQTKDCEVDHKLPQPGPDVQHHL